ncbi:MAG: hypothetical protein IJO09_05065 [Oscillospiraceae bacterium]|nr:hypothetical protein [Oscillospiraceae bacterium]
MISFKCRNCGGEISVDAKGELCCPYCASTFNFSDMDFENYKKFRLDMLNYLRALADKGDDAQDDAFMSLYAEKVSFRAADGRSIDITYLFSFEEDNIMCYVAKNSVVFIFPAAERGKLTLMQRNLDMLDFPAADMKNLRKYFPDFKSIIDLDGGGVLVAINKPANVYPLFSVGNLRAEHVAWIVSRMENLCCVFEFSDITHNGITINNLFINPATHEAYLYGGWWNACRKTYANSKSDLYAIRKVASLVLGEHRNDIPDEFKRFLNETPAADAYSDFERWDYVIEKGFGGHKFIKFSNK